MRNRLILILALASLTPALSADLSVIVDGHRRTEYNHRCSSEVPKSATNASASGHW